MASYVTVISGVKFSSSSLVLLSAANADTCLIDISVEVLASALFFSSFLDESLGSVFSFQALSIIKTSFL